VRFPAVGSPVQDTNPTNIKNIQILANCDFIFKRNCLELQLIFVRSLNSSRKMVNGL